MQRGIRPGDVGEISFTVEGAHAVRFDPAMPPVLSTPWLLWFLEHAAMQALAPRLAAGEVSVGTEIELQHLAPTPVGVTVRCRARVISAEGPAVAFHVEAHDGHEVIARGFHRRRVVKAAGLARRVVPKQPPA